MFTNNITTDSIGLPNALESVSSETYKSSTLVGGGLLNIINSSRTNAQAGGRSTSSSGLSDNLGLPDRLDEGILAGGSNNRLSLVSILAGGFSKSSCPSCGMTGGACGCSMRGGGDDVEADEEEYRTKYMKYKAMANS